MSRRWIFVIGCYNSGTTLLETILRQHTAIAGLPTEGQFLTKALITPKAAGVPRLWAEKEHLFRFFPGQENLAATQVKQDWINSLDDPQAPFAVEKSPTNTARTLWLQHHFEPAYFIHIVRNGYVVARGIHDKVLAVYGDNIPDLLAKAAHQWVRSLEVVSIDAPQLTHLLEISYEDLVTQPFQVMTQIFNFLALPPLPAKIIEQPFVVHGVQSSITNKNAVRLSQLTEEQRRIIYAQAGELLDKYGYMSSLYSALP